MYKSFVTSPEVRSKARDLLKQLDGSSFDESCQALHEAQQMLDHARARLGEQQFSFSRDWTPNEPATSGEER